MAGNYLIVSFSPKLCKCLRCTFCLKNKIKKKRGGGEQTPHITVNIFLSKKKSLIIVIFHQKNNNYARKIIIKLPSISTFLPPHLAVHIVPATFSMARLQFQCWHVPAANKTTLSANTPAETWSNTAHTTGSSQQQCQHLVYSLNWFWKRPTSPQDRYHKLNHLITELLNIRGVDPLLIFSSSYASGHKSSQTACTHCDYLLHAQLFTVQ